MENHRNKGGRLDPGTILAIALAMAAIAFIGGSYMLSDSMNKTADAIGSSSGQDHQPRPNDVQNQPKRPEGTTGSSGITGSQTTNVPPAGRDR